MAAADRHLLLGLLALQNGLISQGQLVHAFQAWTLDKSQSLADHLEARGDLTGAKRALLQALADVHLEVHGGDVETSLAAVPADKSTRESLAELGDPEIEATLARLGSGSTGPDPERTTTYDLGSASSDGQRFRVLRPHARGGLGAVFVALDAELHREVALKRILDHHADDPTSRSRFVLEAEITGGLEHPGIVPVYGLGNYGDGRPYYAMRFVRGDSLKDALASFHADESLKADPGRRSLELRKLLRRFVNVCNAIDYAHTRGVLHRDIKPANVIVGKHGETLVVDWGLAKVMGKTEPGSASDERTMVLTSVGAGAETLPGSLVGTPAYMSPEQAAGDLARVGPRSDVYSLGATLYCLLTGRRPFTEEGLARVLQAVQKGDFPPPRSVDRTIAPELQAVCLMAMALKPEGRYISPRMLAEEIERWMADEPVTAFPEGLARRLARWSRRNRSWVRAGVAALLLVAVVSSVAALAIDQARRGERTALGSATRALTAEKVALSAERAAKVEAQANLGKAEANFLTARDAVDRFFTRMSEDRLLNEPHMEQLRKDLLGNSREYYQKFVSERKDDPNAQADLGAAYLRLSNIDSAMGSMREAIDHAEQARSLFRALVMHSPNTPEFGLNLARCDYSLGRAYEKTGRAKDAEASFTHAMGVQQGLVNAHPEATLYSGELARTFGILGVLHKNTGRAATAEAWHRRALEIQRRLADAHPVDTNHRTALAYTHNNLGVVFRLTGRAKDAEDSYREALDAWQRLAEAHPEVTLYRYELSGCLYNLSNLYLTTGRAAAAEASYLRSLKVGKLLADAHPGVSGYRSDVGRTYNNLGVLYKDTGRAAEAESSYRHALEARQRLADEHPDVVSYQGDLARSHNNLGVLYKDTGRAAEAETSYKFALEVRQRLADAHPEIPNYRLELGKSCNNLGVLFFETGRAADAGLWYARAMAIAEKLVAESPEEFQSAIELGGTRLNLGELSRHVGRPGESRDWYSRAIATLEGVLKREPRHPVAQRLLRDAYEGRAEALGRLGRHAEAVADWDRAVDRGDEKTRDDLRLGRARALRGRATIGAPSPRRRRWPGSDRSRPALAATPWRAS